jgi:hypothetical protein
MKKVYTLTLIALASVTFVNAQNRKLRLTTSVNNGNSTSFATRGNWSVVNNATGAINTAATTTFQASGAFANNDTLEIAGGSTYAAGAGGTAIDLTALSNIILVIGSGNGATPAFTLNGRMFRMSGTSKISVLGGQTIKGITGAQSGTIRLTGNGTATSTYISIGGTSPNFNLKAIAPTTNNTSINITGANQASSTTPNASAATAGTSSGFSLGSLPAVLVSFDAVKQSTGVAISWKTQQEQNTKVFLIEKSIDGASYKAIGSVPAAGNSSTPLSYSFNDASAVSGIVYYRVRIVDLDGKEGFTPVKAVRASANAVKLGVYPNPAVSVANVVVDNAEQVSFSLNIFNRNGQLVAQQRAAAGTNAVNVDVSRFAAGDYMIDVQFANGNRQSSKLIVAQH